MSTTWFVGADWLAEHIDDPEIQIIDARMASPDRKIVTLLRVSEWTYSRRSVFDIEALSDHTSRFRTCCRAWKRSPWRCVN